MVALSAVHLKLINNLSIKRLLIFGQVDSFSESIEQPRISSTPIQNPEATKIERETADKAVVVPPPPQRPILASKSLDRKTAQREITETETNPRKNSLPNIDDLRQPRKPRNPFKKLKKVVLINNHHHLNGGGFNRGESPVKEAFGKLFNSLPRKKKANNKKSAASCGETSGKIVSQERLYDCAEPKSFSDYEVYGFDENLGKKKKEKEKTGGEILQKIADYDRVQKKQQQQQQNKPSLPPKPVHRVKPLMKTEDDDKPPPVPPGKPVVLAEPPSAVSDLIAECESYVKRELNQSQKFLKQNSGRLYENYSSMSTTSPAPSTSSCSTSEQHAKSSHIYEKVNQVSLEKRLFVTRLEFQTAFSLLSDGKVFKRLLKDTTTA